jgi:[ribosomal protein S18]-alanine N-acetyltransferase
MTLAGLQIRDAHAADVEAVLAIERATDTAPHWPLATYAAIVEAQDSSKPPSTGPQRRLFVACTSSESTVAVQNGLIVGFAVGLVPHSAEAVAELESIAVAASARRAGVGRALCVAVLDWCRVRGATSIVLEVRAGSVAAIALYAGLSFLPAGRRPGYYRNPDEDALILQCPLF